MKSTIKDLNKLKDKTYGLIKTGVYYLYIPIVLAIGARTINWSAISQQQM
jgi:hypothetical protein